VSFIDALNLTNFFLANGPNGTSFGRTTSYYNDFSGSADPGSRVIEFRLRVSFQSLRGRALTRLIPPPKLAAPLYLSHSVRAFRLLR